MLFVTAANMAEFAATYGPGLASKFRLVPNGCDPTELQSVAAVRQSDRFILLHAGTLYGQRSPLPVIRAIARAAERGVLDLQSFRLRLLGTAALATDIAAECRRLGVENAVELVPRVTRAQSLQEMKSASALLLIQTGTTVSVPGKAYEYLAAGRPVLALAEEGETASLVRTSGAGVSVMPDAPVEVIEQALLEIVAMAAGPFAPAADQFFDGRVHAAATAALLRELATGDQQAPVATSRPASGPVAQTASSEEAPS